jgi:acyl carrier protein
LDFDQRRPAATATAGQITPTRPLLRDEVEQAAPSARLDLLIAYLQSEIALLLGLDSPEAVDPYRGFFDMGMESLTALALRSRLEKGIGCALPTTFAMNYPTVQTLGNYIGSQLLQLELAAPGAVGSSAAAPADTTLEELEDLSEDELAALIDEQVNQVLGEPSDGRD